MSANHYEFWKDKQSPLHAESSEAYYQRYGEELKLLWRGQRPASVLDLGCGNGDLYVPLGFDLAEIYVGVDFSPAMLSLFRQRRPSLELHELPAEDARWDRTFELIMCNGVIQYMTPASVAKLLKNCRAMSVSGTLLVLGSIPQKRFRSDFLTGRLAGTRRPWRARVRWLLNRWLSDPIGRWWEFRTVRHLAETAGFSCKIFGSVYYPYRFHAVLSPR